MPDLWRQSAHERDLARHVDGGVRDPHGDAVTDPRRVRVPVRSPHPREVTAVVGRHFGGQALDDGYSGRVAMPVEWMGIRAGLCHHSGILAQAVRVLI
ncbi:hypothetical protein Afil01_29940 [Actinorhabdospora filicis]|uniref:Uncharacterized protein n=1 Tax=Actinorhabdospora filicis TaxID=1785913 RepID=A0A9W6W3I1_9ACTN|nr:hypothetical protein Afil01_29940 [Actinorhabdospora filicis]